MIHLANILIVTDDAALGSDLEQKLQPHRYNVRVLADQTEALTQASREPPDIILLSDSFAGGDPITLARLLKSQPATADISLCLIAGELSADLQNRAFAAGMSDLLTPPISEIKLIARLRPLVRLSSMQVELQQRSLAAVPFGLAMAAMPTLRQGDHDDKILLIGENVGALSKHLPNAQTSMVDDPYQAENELEKNNYDVAIAVIEGDPTATLDLCVQTRNNPRLFNLPLILIADPAVVSEETAYHHGVSGYFKEPADPFELNGAVLFLVRRQRQRWAIREALGEVARPAIKDPATGVFSRAFLDCYLKSRVAHAIAFGRPLSIAFFRVPDVENIHQRFGVAQANHLRLQVSQWITRLLRAEDLTARYEENEFCVLLPDSPQSEASLVINRIAGVLAYTDFAVRDVYEPVKVWVRVGSAELNEQDDMDSLVARARQAMIE